MTGQDDWDANSYGFPEEEADEPGKPKAKLATKGGRRVVELGTDEARVADQSIAGLAAHVEAFQRGAALVHVITESRAKGNITRPAGSPYIARVQLPRLREMLSEQIDFTVERSGKGGKAFQASTHAPDWVPRAVAARQQWDGIRHLEAVCATPFIRPDGSIVEIPGWDEVTGVLLRPRREFPRVPGRPSQEHAKAAAVVLGDIFCDFPFATPEHRAAAIAGILSPLARHAYSGPTPLTLIDKNVHGAGGSLLADAIATASTGHGIARMSQAKDDDEERKRMLSIALSGDAIVVIDNIDRPLGGAALDAALTGTEWRDRKLGGNEMAGAPLLAVWFATGNNVVVQRDTLRRVLPIRIETPLEKPEERGGFRHDPLLPYVQQAHPLLVVAALTMLRAFIIAGRPDAGLKPWGSFEGWSELIRGTLVFAGLPDPAKARQDMVMTGDSEANAIRVLVTNWELIDEHGLGVSASRILDNVAHPDGNEKLQALKEALMEIAPPVGGKPTSPKSLGRKLTHLKGRVVAGRALDCRPGNLGQVWFLREAKSVDTLEGLQGLEGLE